MESEGSSRDYGTTRNRRPTVSYAEFERTASSLMAAGDKPGLENIRKAIGGSPETIRKMLRRFWTDLAAHTRSPADSLMRLPSDVADLAEELWQRALTLAAQKAASDDNAARERLDQVKRENEVRAHGLSVLERTIKERQGQRDKTISELREQVATLLTIVTRNTATIAALEARKADAEALAEDYRQRFTTLLSRAVARNREAAARKRGRDSVKKTIKETAKKKSTARAKPKPRSKAGRRRAVGRQQRRVSR